jgi:hypothetical protein
MHVQKDFQHNEPIKEREYKSVDDLLIKFDKYSLQSIRTQHIKQSYVEFEKCVSAFIHASPAHNGGHPGSGFSVAAYTGWHE